MASGSSGLNISSATEDMSQESSDAQRQSTTSSGSAAAQFMEDQSDAEMSIETQGPKDKMSTGFHSLVPLARAILPCTLIDWPLNGQVFFSRGSMHINP